MTRVLVQKYDFAGPGKIFLAVFDIGVLSLNENITWVHNSKNYAFAKKVLFLKKKFCLNNDDKL